MNNSKDTTNRADYGNDNSDRSGKADRTSAFVPVTPNRAVKTGARKNGLLPRHANKPGERAMKNFRPIHNESKVATDSRAEESSAVKPAPLAHRDSSTKQSFFEEAPLIEQSDVQQQAHADAPSISPPSSLMSVVSPYAADDPSLLCTPEEHIVRKDPTSPPTLQRKRSEEADFDDFENVPASMSFPDL